MESEAIHEQPETGFYYHFKHDPLGPLNVYAYEVCGLVRETETEEFAVLYRPLYETEWIKPAQFSTRPLKSFVETIERDQREYKRFTLISDPDIIAALQEIRDKMYSTEI